ncbi:MAG TPA: hypothetical protein VHP11_13390 [Tepidisphaeraceae bacterium]|nr:hypothetical protein [Tepidisphaeraceae bacterium]
MAKEHLVHVTDLQVAMYRSLLRTVGQEVADELYPGVRQYLERRKAGIKERTYVPAGPDRSAIDPAITTQNPIEARPSPPRQR